MKQAAGASNSPPPRAIPGIIRFGNFEADTSSGELRQGGIKLKLSGQPFDVLVALLEKPGQMVTRDELREKLWSQDTFVDFEHGLNKAINKVRDALGDDADNPRFVETLPRRGYRFLVPVEGPAQPGAGVGSDVTRPKRLRVAWLVAGAAAATIAAALIVAAWPARQPRVLHYTQITNDGLKKIYGASYVMATDGSRIYFGERNDSRDSILAQVAVTGGSVNALSNLQNRTYDTWKISKQTLSPAMSVNLDYSPARSEVLMHSGIQSPLWAFSVPGVSTPRRLGDFLVDSAAWAPDGQSIAYSGPNELRIVRADGSESRRLVKLKGDPWHVRWSPDAKVLRFTLDSTPLSTLPSISLWEVAADGSNLHPLFRDWQSTNQGFGSWTADGRYFVYNSFLPNGSSSIFAVREKKGLFEKSMSQPVELTSGPMSFSGPLPGADGKKIFTVGSLNQGQLMHYDSTMHAWVPCLNGISAADVDFSHDGEWVTYVLIPQHTLWRSRADGSQRLQLTLAPLKAALPRWSPDGKRIVFAGWKPGELATIYLISVDGGETEKLLTDNKYYMDPTWSPDGNQIVFGESNKGPKAIHILDLRSRRVSDLPGSEGLFSPRWSPDGRFIIAISGNYQSPEAPLELQRLRPSDKLMFFDVRKEKWELRCEAPIINYPTFSRDEKYVYFSNPGAASIFRVRLSDNKIELVARIDVPGGMKTDDFWFWSGLTPDNSPMFLRDASPQEIYALDVDFP